MRIIRSLVFVSLAGVMLVVICGCAVEGSQGTANQNGDEPEAVTYCQLMKDPKRFHNKVVRVNALYERDFEQSYLFDEEDCPSGKPGYPSDTWVSYDKTFVMEGDSDEAKNNRNVSGSGRWRITAVGRFRRGEDSQRFGHLACCKYDFALIRIEQSEKLR